MSLDKTPEQLEALVLSSLTSPERVMAAVQEGVSSVAFQIPENRAAWDRLLETATHGKPHPSLEDLRQIGVSVVEDVSDAEIYVKELSRVSLAGRAYLVLQRHVPSIEDTPQAAVHKIVREFSDLASATNVHVGRTDQGASTRVEHLKEMREQVVQGKDIGITTGLPAFDDKQDGWRPGEVIAIIGILGAGKSFLLTYFCCQAYLAGKKVLLISPENPVIDMEFRVDTFLARMSGEEWDFTLRDLRTAFTKFPKEEAEKHLKKYAEWCERFSWRDDWVTIDTGEHGPFSVENVLSLAREHRPDLLAVDGFHLIRGNGKQGWEQIFETGQLIKGVTQELGMTTIGVAQANRASGVIPDEPPELHEVAYGMGIVEAADRVLSIGKTRGNKNRRSFKVPKFRNGEEIQVRQHLEFDVNIGNISQIVKETKNKEAGGSDEVERF